MISIDEKRLCCGCRACEQVCPCGAIQMKMDEEGFLYPVVNEEKCVGCNACNKVCPVEDSKVCEKQLLEYKIDVYGGWNKDEDIRSKSSSGGAFSLFAEKIIHMGGKVYGCILDENLKAVHVGVDSIGGLQALRGSKYVQSDTAYTYSDVKKNLMDGRQVLFVGTPCQAAGLYTFLGKKMYENLYIIDFICHGVPSPRIFADYIKRLEEKQGNNIIEFKFRNKDKGWSQTGLQLGTFYKCQNGTSVRKYPAFRDKYMNGFLDDVMLRPSCYDCKFKSLPKSYADFTIADFWGVDKVSRDLNDGKGTSLVLVNTEKGKKLWDRVNGEFIYQQVEASEAIKRNPPLLKSATFNAKRDEFFKDYQNNGYDYVEKKYFSAFVWGMHKALSLASGLWNRFGQFIKFGIVGCSNTIINLAVYYLCLYCGMHYLGAYTMGFLVSVCNAFYWNNKYVFKNKRETSIVKAFIKSFTSYGFSFLLSLILMSVMVEILKISSLIAPILKLLITIPLNFVLNKIWAFKDKK